MALVDSFQAGQPSVHLRLVLLSNRVQRARSQMVAAADLALVEMAQIGDGRLRREMRRSRGTDSSDTPTKRLRTGEA